MNTMHTLTLTLRNKIGTMNTMHTRERGGSILGSFDIISVSLHPAYSLAPAHVRLF